MMIDSHAHLTWSSFETDFEAVVERSIQAGVKTVINIGADLQSSHEAVDITGWEQSGISFYSSIGLHPHDVSRLLNEEQINQTVSQLEDLYPTNPQKIVAIGECGLDYYFEGNEDYTPSDLSIDDLKKLQMVLFKAQLNLAKKLNLPLVIHNRDAWEDILIPELDGTRGVFHSFRGTEEEAEKVLSLGYYLGITCVITYPKNDLLRQIVKETPLDRLLTETDCPYLPPQRSRGQRNEPANITEVVQVIAEVKAIPQSQVIEAISANTQQLFGIKTI